MRPSSAAAACRSWSPPRPTDTARPPSLDMSCHQVPASSLCVPGSSHPQAPHCGAQPGPAFLACSWPCGPWGDPGRQRFPHTLWEEAARCVLLVRGVTLQCRTVFAPVLKCGLRRAGDHLLRLPPPPMCPVLALCSQKPLVAVPLHPVAFPRLTGNHTAQGKGVPGGWGAAAQEGPCPTLPQALFPPPFPTPAASQVRPSGRLTQQPLPSRGPGQAGQVTCPVTPSLGRPPPNL